MSYEQTPPPPDDRTTFSGMNVASSLCTTGHPTNHMTGVLLRLLQEHFSRAENLLYNGSVEIGKGQLERYLWTPSAETTKIQIQPSYLWNSEDVQRRPALYVKRNKWKSDRIAIDDSCNRGATVDADGKLVRVDGALYTRIITGSHTVFCVTQGDGAAAELLGYEVFDFLTSFAPLFREDFNLLRCEVPELEGVSVLEESTAHFAVPVVMSYGVSMSWRLNAVAPWLKSFAIDLKSR